MSADNGFNPLLYKCGNGRCFNMEHRPKIEVFAECFPGKIAMTDIDAVVELNGHFLFMEFKSAAGILKTGQRILFEQLSRLSPKVAVLVIVADAPTMDCYHVRHILNGQISDWEPITLESLKDSLRDWSRWVFQSKKLIA